AGANAKRKAEIYAEVAGQLMGQADREVQQEGKQLLYLLDSSSFTLTGTGFDRWTAENRTRNTQGIKLHVLFARDGEVPVWSSITAPNINDRDEGIKIELQRGAVYVFDKAYYDYNWWYRINQAGAHFVSRFKRNAGLVVERECPIPAAAAEVVLKDEIVRFKHKHPSGGRRNHYEQPLRRITVARPQHDTPLVLATNDLCSCALTIAQHYKQRWDIELFFKWIKQHLKIKSFLGRTENAVRIQILTALIAYLLLATYRKKHGITTSLWHLLAELRTTLFQRPALEVEQY